MNYALHYERLIERARRRVLNGYVEGHHVVPRCMGGCDGENIVELTPEEHFVAHLLLVKINPGVPGLVSAAFLMASVAGRSKQYGWLRRRYVARLALLMTPELKAKLRAARASLRGSRRSPESKAKMSRAMTGNKNGLGKPCSAEKRAKIAASKIGKPRSLEAREKMRAARLAYLARTPPETDPVRIAQRLSPGGRRRAT